MISSLTFCIIAKTPKSHNYPIKSFGPIENYYWSLAHYYITLCILDSINPPINPLYLEDAPGIGALILLAGHFSTDN